MGTCAPLFRTSLFAVGSLLLFCAAPAHSFETHTWYKLTTQWQGKGKALDVVNDGRNNRIQLAATGNYSGQLWKLTPARGGYYRLTTQWQGEGKSLDVVNDGVNNKLQLADTGNYSGQFWKLSPLPGDYYRLTTQWQGEGKALDVVNDGVNNKLQLADTGNYSGQFWKITPVNTAQPVRNATPEARCFEQVQGKVAWSRNGSQSWQAGNIKKLCAGTQNPQKTINCFKQGIAAHNNWSKAIAECAGQKRAVEAGPIWSQADAEQKCPRIASQHHASWTGHWWTTVQGKMSVCEIR